jgi:hypothetical protein
MSADQKSAIKQGRLETSAVSRYLDALAAEARSRRSGPRQTVEGLAAKIASIDADLPTAKPLTKVQLIQEKMDAQARLLELESSDTIDIEALKADFIAHAASFSYRKGVSHAAWREIGVPSDVLKQAGITRSS